MITWKGFADTPDKPGDYWHDAMIQDLIARIPEWSDVNLLVMPGHFKADTDQINEYLTEPAIVWVLGDEEGDAQFWNIDAPVWKQFPNPHRPYWPDRVLPLGYTPHTRPALDALGLPLTKSGWVLSGQNTNVRRKQAFTALEQIDPSRIHPSPTFAGGHAPADFIRQLWEVEWAPCPAGNVRADSFRMWEALECGTVPIVDATSPVGDRNVWPDTIGDSPIPVIEDWSTVGDILSDPAPMAETGVWYARYKRDLVKTLLDDWAALTKDPWPEPEDRITTVVTASPLPSHPDFDILAETVESVRSRLPGNEICIAFDGARGEENYAEHIRRVAWYANQHWPEVWLWWTDKFKHQAGTVKDVLPHVREGALLMVEADTPLTGEIPFRDLVTWIYTGQFDHIRLHYDTSIHPEHQYLTRGVHPQQPVTRTAQYSQRPHVTTTWYYKDLLASIPDTARTYIEDAVYGPIVNSPWEHNKLGIYTPPGNIQRSTHLDGRAGEPKKEFWT